MTALKISSCAAMAAAVASFSSFSDRVNADGPFRFYPFSSPPSTEQASQTTPPKVESKPAAEEPKRSSSSGFDPESLERGAKVLREINSSRNAKQVFDVMRKQEEVRLTEQEAEQAQFKAVQAQADIERQRKMGEEQRNLLQQQAQAKAQMARYEDELARKRMQADHETQRQHNAELVRMQEESSIRKEKARRTTEEQIQAQQRQTEKERAEIERETIRVKAMAEAEARAHEAKLTEDHNRRMLLKRISGEREKWLAAINTTFSHIEGGFRILLTDRSKLLMAVGGATALAAGVYTTREGARVTWGYINRILGQPSLIRESSFAKFPWSGIVSHGLKKVLNYDTGAQRKTSFRDIILHPSLQRRIEQLARATENTKSHQAPFRNMLFYGPPGTGKTMVAREIARKSVSTFIYNHGHALQMLREKCGGDLVRPGITRFATNYIALKSFEAKKPRLRAMFASTEWFAWRGSDTPAGRAARETINSEGFWHDVKKVVTLLEPLVKVLRMVDSEKKPTLPHLYAAIDMMKRHVHAAIPRGGKRYLEIIQTRWEKMLMHPMHKAAYYLNPKYQYKCKLGLVQELVDAVQVVVEKLEPNSRMQSKCNQEGLDYAMMTGGDVAPLGPQAVTKIHQIFDWAKKSKEGLLLFIDEADAFLCERNSTHMSEAQRSALNALLFRTGDQSRDMVLVLATNRPGDLDSAITDRMDEVIEFPLPREEERVKLLKLYLNKYLSNEEKTESLWGSFVKKQQQKITVKDISEDVIREAARKTEGFSGREIAKLMASVQAAVYGSPDCVLDSQLFSDIVDYKVAEHHQRIKIAAEGVQLA